MTEDILIATYKRTSSAGQRERETIEVQEEQLERALAADQSRVVVARFSDDGVSGRMPFADRPGGRALLAAAQTGQFQELHVYDSDRMGRDAVEIHIAFRELDRLHVTVISLAEATSATSTFAPCSSPALKTLGRRSAAGRAMVPTEQRAWGAPSVASRRTAIAWTG